jgi:hypothetical protein
LVKIDVGVTERTTGHGITADADGGYRSDCVEDFEEKTLVYIRKEVSDVKGSVLEGSCSSIGGTGVTSFRGSSVGRHFIGCFGRHGR